MSYTFLQELGGVSSAESFADIPPYALSSLTNIAVKSYSKDSATVSCQDSQFGMTSPLSMENPGAEKLTISRADSPAKESAAPAKGKGSTMKKADCGESKPESLAKFDRASHSWKTRQHLLLEVGYESLATLPKWGMTVAGALYPLPTPSGLSEHRAWIMNGLESGLGQRLPTLTSFDATCGDLFGKEYNGKTKHAMKLIQAIQRLRTPQASDADKWNNMTVAQRKAKGQQIRLTNQLEAGGNLNPEWTEWFMGWPIGWTGLEPLAMDKFQLWRQSLGEH